MKQNAPFFGGEESLPCGILVSVIKYVILGLKNDGLVAHKIENEGTDMKKVILASASPRRRELLKQAGFSFEVIESKADEHVSEKEPEVLVRELAKRKALAVAELINGEALVIGADTVVAIDGEILGKPKDEADAFRMLKEIQGRTHQVYTGVALIKKQETDVEVNDFAERTDVTMYPMSDEEIYAYIATGEPGDKAGSYGIQGRAAIFIKGIQGDYNNVVGLPIGRLYQEVKSWITEA